MSSSRLFNLGVWLAGLAVAIGAFGAHALKDLLIATGREDTFETAYRYQMYHGLALLILATLGERLPSGTRSWAGWLFLAGIVLFSGSLYALCLLQMPALGIITPFGGICFLAGWGVLIAKGVKA